MYDQVAAIRAFNRRYTRVIGLLNEGMLQSPFNLAEARVIHEIGKREPVTARVIADELGMDRAQLSRLIKKLADQAIIETSPSAEDARAANLRLTEPGEAACAMLNAMSDDAVRDLISELDQAQSANLVSAMDTILALMTEVPKAPAPFRLRAHRLGELGWLIQRQGILYNQEFGWNAEFEALIAGIYSSFAELPEDPPKKLWVAESDGRIAGSIFVQPHAEDPKVAQLRMLYVEPWARGQGIGDRLVAEVVQFARDSNYRSIRLWTQDSLKSARRIYERAGFQLESEYPNLAFGKQMTSQILKLDLA